MEDQNLKLDMYGNVVADDEDEARQAVIDEYEKRFYDEDEDEDDENDDDDDDDDEDDEDDGVGKKLKKLKGKLDGIALAFLFIGFMGIVSLICGLFVGKGTTDPKDYYGTYYGMINSYYATYHIDEDAGESYVELSNGIDMFDPERVDFEKYEYVSAADAQSKLNVPAPDYAEYDALFLYVNDDEVHVLWIVENSPYKFIINTTKTELTNKEYNFREDMSDPRDYYCTYTYNDNTYVTFNEDGTATFSNNGNIENYSFAFVNRSWGTTNGLNFDGDFALILYTPGENSGIITFIYESKTTLVYADQYTFQGTGSETLPGTGSSNDGNDGENNDGDGDTMPLNWSELLDYSNITITTERTGYGTGYDITTSLKIMIEEDSYGSYKACRSEITMAGYYDGEYVNETSICYTDYYDSYYYSSGVRTDVSVSQALTYYYDVTDYIDSINTEELYEVEENVYTDGDATIYLNSDGKVEKIEFSSSNILYFSNQGTTVVTAP